MPALSLILSRWCSTSLLAATFVFYLSAPDAQVPPKQTTIEPVFVTAARSPQPLAELIADVTTIGPEEIARAGALSLAELLARVPGVEIAMNGGPGSTSSVFLRGANRGHTLVLIDGLRIGSSSDGATAFEAIPLEQIDHIEILRGPASSLYGADAIGGVIQIFTRRSDGMLAANTNMGGRTTSRSRMAICRLRSSVVRKGSAPTLDSRSPHAIPIPSPASGNGETGRRRCRQTCAATTARSSAAKRPARLPTATRSATAGAPARVMAPRSRSRRSTTCTTRVFQIPASSRRRRATSRPRCAMREATSPWESSRITTVSAI